MRRFTLPIVSILVGLLASYGLQHLGVAPFTAKLIAVGIVIVFIALVWRKRAAL